MRLSQTKGWSHGTIFNFQRWSRGHNVRDQGLKKKSEAKAKDRLFGTDPLEAKDRNDRGQGPRIQVF